MLKFNSILSAHENEDGGMSVSSEKLIEAVRREFANAEQILDEVKARNITAEEFFSGKKSLEVLPVRTCLKLNIKKHTTEQRPYRHTHDFYEFVCVHSGECVQELDGVTVKLKAGQCCLIVPGSVHSLSRSGDGDIIIKLDLPVSLFNAADGCLLIKENPPHTRANIFSMSEDVKWCVLKLLEESVVTDDCTAVAEEGLLKVFIAGLCRGGAVSGGLLAEVENYVYSDIGGASLEGFARAYGYAPAYASRLISAKTQKTFSEILRECRLTEAKNLLAKGKAVEEAATACGYSSISGFYRQFCARYGITPAEYARMFR